MTLEENLRPIRDQRQNPTQCNLNKQLLRKFAKENSINLLSLKFNVDHKRIAECVNNSNWISTKKPTGKRPDWDGWKSVIIEIEENLVE